MQGYINRSIQEKFLRMSKSFRAVLLNGPRQVGKTTMLEHLAGSEKRTYVTLDNLEVRNLAKSDPALFFQTYKPPILIDEVQYAPELFNQIKIICDTHKIAGEFWLTGSQNYSMMKNVSESLAGRIGILNLYSFSFNELNGIKFKEPFELNLESLIERGKSAKPVGAQELFRFIWQGGMPAMIGADSQQREVYFESYINSYLMRDAMDLGGITDAIKFRKFLTACAAETSQQLSLTKLAGVAEIAVSTAKEWLNLLEGMNIVHFLQPYSNNQLKRLVKTPKLYFWDTGLCAYLSKWLSPDTLFSGAAAGAFFETFVVNELIKNFNYFSMMPNISYYRDSNNKEVDIVLEMNGRLHPIEIKLSSSPNNRDVKKYELLDKSSVERGMGAIICMYQSVLPIDKQNIIVPAFII